MASLISVVVLGASLIPWAVDPPAPPPPLPQGGGMIKGELKTLKVVSADREDKGVVPVGVTVHRRVTFVNTASYPVVPRVVSKTCGCASVKFEPETVKPNESATLLAEVAPAAILGPQTHGVTFEVYRPAEEGRPEESLERGVIAIRYTADLTVQAIPEQLTLEVPVGETRSATFVVANSGGAAIDLTTLRGDTDSVRCALTAQLPKSWREGEVGTQFTVTAKGERIGNAMHVVSPNGSRAAEVLPRVFVRVLTTPAVRFTPSAVTVDALQSSKELVMVRVGASITKDTQLVVRTTVPWASARFEGDQQEGRIVLTVDAKAPVRSGCEVEVVNPSGVVLGRVPVTVWTTPR